MEASALRYSGGIGLQGRSPLLRLQSDERLIAYTRRGSQAAFEILVSRYQPRLLAFCRHLLGSREDAEDIIQEVFAAAFNALLADDRQINVRPWLYRIARNRSLNHLRRAQAVGVDSMDVHFSEHGASTADKVQQREQFRLLVGDIRALPETQRSALLLREMEALSYEQIAEAMDTTVPGVKSLLVRARISLAEAAEARQLSCSEVRLHLGEVAEGLRRRPETVVRRHLRGCQRCSSFQDQLRSTNKALGLLLPFGPLALLRRLVAAHVGHSAGSGSSATAGVGASASGGTAAAGSASSIGMFSAGALVTKTAAGVAAAVVFTAGAVEVSHVVHHSAATHPRVAATALPAVTVATVQRAAARLTIAPVVSSKRRHHRAANAQLVAKSAPVTVAAAKHKQLRSIAASKRLVAPVSPAHRIPAKPQPLPGRTQSQTSQTVLPAKSGADGASPAPDKPDRTHRHRRGSKSGGSLHG